MCIYPVCKAQDSKASPYDDASQDDVADDSGQTSHALVKEVRIEAAQDAGVSSAQDVMLQGDVTSIDVPSNIKSEMHV